MPFFKSLSALLLLASLAASAPTLNVRDADLQKQNGVLAQQANAQFAKIKATDACSDELPQACIEGAFAQCVGGKWVVTQCAVPTKCFSLPLVNSPGNNIACALPSDALSRFKDSGVTGGPTGTDNGDNADQATNGDDNDDDCDDGDDTGANPDDDDADCDDDDTTGANPATPTPRTVIRATPSSPSTVQAPPSVQATSSAGGGYGSGYGDNYRRQLQVSTAPILTTPSPTVAISSSVAAPSATDIIVLPASFTTLSTSSSVITLAPSVTATPTATSSGGLVTPTVVIGTDGIVTVTIVSTVTVTPTDCSAQPSSSILSTGTPVPTLLSSSGVLVPSVSTGLPSSASSVALPSITFTSANPTTSSTITPVVTPTISGFDNFSELLTANTTPTAAV